VKDIVEQNTESIYCMWNRWGTPKNPEAKNKNASDYYQPHKSMQAQYSKETIHCIIHTFTDSPPMNGFDFFAFICKRINPAW